MLAIAGATTTSRGATAAGGTKGAGVGSPRNALVIGTETDPCTAFKLLAAGGVPAAMSPSRAGLLSTIELLFTSFTTAITLPPW